MRPLLSFFGQFVLICLGYVLATFAVGMFAWAAVDRLVGEEAVVSVATHGTGGTAPLAVAFGITATLAAGTIGFFPAVVAIAFAEAFGVRSVFFYMLAAVAVAVLLAAPVDVFADGIPPEAAPVPFLIGCGAVGGVVYWLVAGRRAGCWRERLPGP